MDSSVLLENEGQLNRAVFFRKDKIMNTVCGLDFNTDEPVKSVDASTCSNGQCSAMVEALPNMKFAYAGGILKTDWEVVRQATNPDNSTLAAIGAVAGSVLGIIVMTYFMLLNIYG